VFCIYLGTDSNLCHLQHKLVFITEMKSVYCAVRAGSVNKVVVSLSKEIEKKGGGGGKGRGEEDLG